mmetsp:Transcript_134345/g.299523  ORF Transcript_134345/g.299523 Transcript_134345/m.299523 type:complete len:221 (-) Transcript_134345:843-1505(-)
MPTAHPHSLVAHIVEGRDQLQLFLYGSGHFQTIDEGVDSRLCHRLVRPREVSKRLIGLRVLFSSEDVLDRLPDDRPIRLEIGVDGGLIDDQLPETPLQRVHRDGDVPEGPPDVPQHRGVGEVALQPADGELLREMLQDCVRHPQVALGVLKVDGIHLVRHSARPHLSGDDLLLEVLIRHIHPHVLAHVEEDSIDPLHSVEDGTHVVVVLDLRGVLLPLQA